MNRKYGIVKTKKKKEGKRKMRKMSRIVGRKEVAGITMLLNLYCEIHEVYSLCINNIISTIKIGQKIYTDIFQNKKYIKKLPKPLAVKECK